MGLPWWLSGEESACQCGRHGCYPWCGKIPYATGQLSPCAAFTEARVPESAGAGTTEPACHHYWSPCARERRSCHYWARMPPLLKPVCPRAPELALLSPHAATTEARAHESAGAGTTEPTNLLYWSLCARERRSWHYWARMPPLPKPVCPRARAPL